MTSTKYIGYVGGVAVAMGVGAAIAAASQGTAHAESTDSGSKDTASSSSSSPNAGPKKSDTKAESKTDSKSDRTKPVSKVNDGRENAGEKIAAHITKTASTVSKSITDSLTKPAAKPVTDKADKPAAKPSAEEFEAKAVERLKNLFTPKEVATPKPGDSALEDKSDSEPAAEPASKKATATPTVRTAVETQADTTADTAADAQPWNPLRPDDQEPPPADIPDEIVELRNALMAATPAALDAFDPFIREATEQIYRGTQIVPWVNAVIPISKILPNLAPAVQGDLDARQTIINELIKTTPIGSFAYYGYDIAADLLNLEEPGARLKDQAVATVWDFLDPFELAHNTGKSGIGNAV